MLHLHPTAIYYLNKSRTYLKALYLFNSCPPPRPYILFKKSPLILYTPTYPIYS